MEEEKGARAGIGGGNGRRRKKKAKAENRGIGGGTTCRTSKRTTVGIVVQKFQRNGADCNLMEAAIAEAEKQQYGQGKDLIS